MGFGEGISPTEAVNTILASYKVEGYPKELPPALLGYVRSHLPGWEVVGMRPWHHHPTIWFRNVETGKIVVAMRGTIPTTWRTVFRGEWLHNWGRNLINELFGPHGDFENFLAETSADFGQGDFWSTHSGSAIEVWNMGPNGEIFMINPHPPKGESLGPNVVAVRKRDDSLTGTIWRHHGEMRNIGTGGHGAGNAGHSLSGIHSGDGWETICPERFRSAAPFTGPVEQIAASDYPCPDFDDGSDLYKSAYKRLKAEKYAKFRQEELDDILRKTSNPRKIGEKLDKVFDDLKGHPVSQATRDELKQSAYEAVKGDEDYLSQLELLRRRSEIDRRIAAGETVIVDEMPPSDTSSTQAQNNDDAPPSADGQSETVEPDADDAAPANDPGNVKVGSRESTAVPPTVSETLLEGVGDTFVGHALSATVTSLAFGSFSRWWWPEEVKRKDTPGKMVADSVVTGATAGGFAAGVRVVGNGLASVGMLTSEAVSQVFVPGVLTTIAGVGQVYSFGKMALECVREEGFRPTSVTLTERNLRALQPVRRHSYRELTGVTGEAIRARRESRRHGEPVPTMGSALYAELNREYR
jgi:hypothetical protein